MKTAQMTGAIWFDTVEALSADGIAFDDWYGNDHLGGLNQWRPKAEQRRYASAARACMTVIIELGDAQPVQTPPDTRSPLARRHEHFLARPLSTQHRPQAGPWIEARIAYPVFFAVPPAEAGEFNDWYEEEHLGILFGCSSWLACRRFEIAGPHPQGWTHLALHYLADASALRSPERTAARSTPWRDRLAARPWFKGDYRVLHRLA